MQRWHSDCKQNPRARHISDLRDRRVSTGGPKETFLETLEEDDATTIKGINLEKAGLKPIGDIIVNVGGRVFKIEKLLILSRQNTRLEKVVRGGDATPGGIKLGINEYFFDRNPDIFQYIVVFYKTGNLHIPHTTCSKIIQCELKFWRIRDVRIEPCCWTIYNTRLQETQQVLELLSKCKRCDFETDFMEPYVCADSYNKYLFWLRSLFTVQETMLFPTNTMYFLFINLVIAMSIYLSCLQSMESLRVSAVSDSKYYHPKSDNSTIVEKLMITKPPDQFLGLDLFFNIIFVSDQCFRFMAVRNKHRFFSSFLNLNDLFCNISSIIYLSFWCIKLRLTHPLERISYLVRSLRIFNLFRYHRGLKMMFCTIAISMKDLAFLFGLFIILVVMFGSVMFITEFYGGQPEITVTNLPESFYWSAITLTSVGYGDFVPSNSISCLVAAIAGICSIVIIVLPVPILAETFCLYYEVVKIEVIDKLTPIQRLMGKRKKMYFM